MGQIPDRDKHTQSCKTRIIYDTEGEAQGIELSASSDTECNSSGILLYRKNLQGDITGLINTEGKLLCEFTYDAYGNIGLHTESNLGAVLSGIVLTLFIPQLYRGYVYTFVGDKMCYYLGSRFYSPKLGRFLNADKHTDTGTGVNGTNMFAYCNNNPVVFIDPTGEAMRSILSLVNTFVNFVNVIIKAIKNMVSIGSTAPRDPYESLEWGYVFADKRFTKISSKYKEERRDGQHKGIDIISNDPSFSIAGANILSPCAGTVVYTTYEKSAGNYIVIKSDQKDPLTGKPLMLGFMHMKNFPTLKKNSRVTKGTVLGQVGSTGESSGPHLHLNIWTDANNVWATINTVVNPQKYFPNIQFTGETSNAD